MKNDNIDSAFVTKLELFLAALEKFKGKKITVRKVMESINQWHCFTFSEKQAFGKLVWRKVRLKLMTQLKRENGSDLSAVYLVL